MLTETTIKITFWIFTAICLLMILFVISLKKRHKEILTESERLNKYLEDYRINNIEVNHYTILN